MRKLSLARPYLPRPTDPTESNNLFTDPDYADAVAALKARLTVLGAAAPPWAVVPEVEHMSSSQLNTMKCDAAKRLGALAPIDV
jgi:hypothetical protein